MLKVTTSWDDGDILDMRLSDLLSKNNIKGTFYISKNYRQNRLEEKDIKNISEKHEIGAHTISHPDLRSLTQEKKTEEISSGKAWLEKIIEGKIEMFCYPKGLYDESSVKIVEETGFIGARTTKMGRIDNPLNPFLSDTTIQVYPFPLRKLNAKKYYLGRLFEPYNQRAPELQKIGVSTLSMYSWLSMAKATFDVAKKNKGVFHLWGHSWEIDKYGMWDELEKFLQYIGNREDCIYLTNGEIIKTIK